MPTLSKRNATFDQRRNLSESETGHDIRLLTSFAEESDLVDMAKENLPGKGLRSSGKKRPNTDRLSDTVRRNFFPEIPERPLTTRQTNTTRPKASTKAGSKTLTSSRKCECPRYQKNIARSSSPLDVKPVKLRRIAVGNEYSRQNRERNPSTKVKYRNTVFEEKTSSPPLETTTPRTSPRPLHSMRRNLFEEFIDEMDFENFSDLQIPDFDQSIDTEFMSYYDPLSDKPLSFHTVRTVDNESPPPAGRDFTTFREILGDHPKHADLKNSLTDNDFQILRNILKNDERYRQMQKDDLKMFKEILSFKLDEIKQTERVVNVALQKIRSNQPPEEAEQPLEDQEEEISLEEICREPLHDIVPALDLSGVKATFKKSKSPTKRRTQSAREADRNTQEVNVCFKNVPSLEREIQLLKTLSLKLEDTLLKCLPKRISDFRQVTAEYYAIVECRALSRVIPTAPITITYPVLEFEVTCLSIQELKEKDEFFIPTEKGCFLELKRTNFLELNSDPEKLIKLLQPAELPLKTDLTDTFFNNFLLNMYKVWVQNLNITNYPFAMPFAGGSMHRTGGGGGDFAPIGYEQRRLRPCAAQKRKLKKVLKAKEEVERELQAMEHVVRLSTRHTLVAILQIFVFAFFIILMAYPEPICLND